MEVHATVDRFREALDGARRQDAVVGLVPTMGYLHEGHLSLMLASGRDCDVTAASIFVNPLQFGPGEDLGSYPRDLDRDLALCEQAGVRHVLVPSVEEMYPVANLTTVAVSEISSTMEGTARPTHFAGVTTVVAKLCNVAGPCRAYFGEKDFQQLVIVRRMVSDLNMPVEVVGCPIVREPDGLAMSSRNVYLTTEERAAAAVLHAALLAGAATVESGQRDPDAVREVMAAVVRAEPLAGLDYAEARDAADLRVPVRLEGEVRLLVAARFGKPRLLDNLGVHVT